MSSDVIMPQKAVLRPDASRDEILNHYTAEGMLPRPFAPFMGGGLSGGEPDRKRSSVSSFLSVGRNSFLSLGSSSHRFSVASAATSVSSAGAAGKRKVRQLFTPVLPDELVLSLGERVTGTFSLQVLPPQPKKPNLLFCCLQCIVTDAESLSSCQLL